MRVAVAAGALRSSLSRSDFPLNGDASAPSTSQRPPTATSILGRAPTCSTWRYLVHGLLPSSTGRAGRSTAPSSRREPASPSPCRHGIIPGHVPVARRADILVARHSDRSAARSARHRGAGTLDQIKRNVTPTARPARRLQLARQPDLDHLPRIMHPPGHWKGTVTSNCPHSLAPTLVQDRSTCLK